MVSAEVDLGLERTASYTAAMSTSRLTNTGLDTTAAPVTKKFGVDDAIKVKQELHPAFVDYKREKLRLERYLFLAADAAFEISNEATNIFFAVDELMKEDHLLFLISMGFLGVTLLLRLVIALLPLREVIAGTVKVKPAGGRLWFATGVLCSLVEPLSGNQLTMHALNDKAKGSMGKVDSDAAAESKKLRSESKTMLRNCLAMLVVEDIPEFIIQVVYLFRTGGRVQNVPLFVITVPLTVFHLIRICVTIWFELKYAPHIPDPDAPHAKVEIQDGSIGKLQALVVNQTEWCHTVCSVSLLNFKGDGSQLVGDFSGYMVRHSKSLGWMKLEAQVGDVFGMDIGHALAYNVTLTFLALNGNQLTDESGREIARALAQNTTLQELHLVGNQLIDSGREIAHSLVHNTTLQELHMTKNLLTDGSGRELARAMIHNTALQIFFLGNNQLTDATGKEFAGALTTNTALQRLNLSNNLISESTKGDIKRVWGTRVGTPTL